MSAPIVKWVTNSWSEKIAHAEFVRETTSCVWSESGRRFSKDGMYDTWAQAHAALVNRQQNKVDSLRLQLERANGQLGNFKGMKEPS